MNVSCFTSLLAAALNASLLYDDNDGDGHLWRRDPQVPLPTCAESSLPPSGCLVCRDQQVHVVCPRLPPGVRMTMEAVGNPVRISESRRFTALMTSSANCHLTGGLTNCPPSLFQLVLSFRWSLTLKVSLFSLIRVSLRGWGVSPPPPSLNVCTHLCLTGGPPWRVIIAIVCILTFIILIVIGLLYWRTRKCSKAPGPEEGPGPDTRWVELVFDGGPTDGFRFYSSVRI